MIFFQSRNVICTLKLTGFIPDYKDWSLTWMKSRKLRISHRCVGIHFWNLFPIFLQNTYIFLKVQTRLWDSDLSGTLWNEVHGSTSKWQRNKHCAVHSSSEQGIYLYAEEVFNHLYTIVGPFYCISWRSLKEQLYTKDDTAVKFVHCAKTISWF